jgi:hypothetical protein
VLGYHVNQREEFCFDVFTGACLRDLFHDAVGSGMLFLGVID